MHNAMAVGVLQGAPNTQCHVNGLQERHRAARLRNEPAEIPAAKLHVQPRFARQSPHAIRSGTDTSYAHRLAHSGLDFGSELTSYQPVAAGVVLRQESQLERLSAIPDGD